MDFITIKGAKEHNLRNVDLTVPKNKLIVFTGVSGSGKSSMAFDTIYTEGRRRYVESLSSYARMFLGGTGKSDVESIEGLSPAIAIEQKSVNNNPRSTVGTLTEIYDYYRLLYSKIGVQHCPECGRPLEKVDIDQIIDFVLKNPEGTRIAVLAPVLIERKTIGKKIFEDALSAGFTKAYVNGELYSLDSPPKLDKKFKYSISIVIDRLIVSSGERSRIAQSIETSFDIAGGNVEIATFAESGKVQGTKIFSQKNTCPHCGVTAAEMELRLFSFNSPVGACPKCNGLGKLVDFDIEKIIPDRNLSFDEGAIKTSNPYADWARVPFEAFCASYGIKTTTPMKDIPAAVWDKMVYGVSVPLSVNYKTKSSSSGGQVIHSEYMGVVPELKRRYKQTFSSHIRAWLETFMTEQNCPDCHGERLNKSALAVKVGGLNIAELLDLSVDKALTFFSHLELTPNEKAISKDALKSVVDRLTFLKDVGLSYLTLSRLAGTLSGGEAQRIRLASQLGSALTGVLYVLDEPSIGLHQRDNQKLINTLMHLRDLGNTVVVVEHDEDTIRSADFVADFGPGAGVNGGRVVASGTPEEIAKTEGSITGAFLSGREKIEVPTKRRNGSGDCVSIKGARKNNLRGFDVEIPLGKLVCVTGVSGSGKSTLLNEILVPNVKNYLNSKFSNGDGAQFTPVSCDEITVPESIQKLVVIDQDPIGRTPRSNPATYVGVFTPIRELFCETLEARSHGWNPGRFSFNVPGGRCEECQGDGKKKIEMHFLPDVYVPCEVCGGRRFNKETLQALFKGKSIADVLEMSFNEAKEFFKNQTRIEPKIRTVCDVGLGYITLGQSATELSGGEAQRVKLALELSKVENGNTLYILDEPTTGLHSSDVKMLLKVLTALVEKGNSVVLIEHNLDVVKSADYLIDLGPEGGDGGGSVVATGVPEEVARVKGSYTGQFLKSILNKG